MSEARTTDASNMLWQGIKQEITGIQVLLETVEQMYFRSPRQRGMDLLAADAPLLFVTAQTAMMESLLMRMSRLMDPASTGKRHNVSLNRLAGCSPILEADICELRQQWDASGLKTIRDKYLSHNDLERSMAEAHTLNIPLSDADVSAMQSLANGLRVFRCAANLKISGAAYLDQHLDLCVQREVACLSRSLLAGEAFYKLLPGHPGLQEVLAQIEHQDPKGA